MESGDLEKQRQQLLGSGTEQMNLSLVKDRAQELRAQIAATIGELRANPGGISFERVLDKFSILNAQYDQLQRELRPQLRYHIAHPLQVDGTLAALLPHQLATKVLPEMETLEHDFLREYPTHRDGEGAIESALLTLCRKPDAHNDAINRLFDKATVHSAKAGPLHEQSEEQSVIKSNSKKVQKAIKTRLEILSSAKGRVTKPPGSKATAPVGSAPAWLKLIQGSAD